MIIKGEQNEYANMDTQDIWKEIILIIFYVLLTVHPGTTLGKRPTLCTITLYKSLLL